MEGTGGLHILSTIIYTSVLILICLVSTLLVRDHKIYIFIYSYIRSTVVTTRTTNNKNNTSSPLLEENDKMRSKKYL